MLDNSAPGKKTKDSSPRFEKDAKHPLHMQSNQFLVIIWESSSVIENHLEILLNFDNREKTQICTRPKFQKQLPIPKKQYLSKKKAHFSHKDTDAKYQDESSVHPQFMSNCDTQQMFFLRKECGIVDPILRPWHKQ